MNNVCKIANLTVLLSVVAGYCDTLTFVTADAVFSSHVTGNFIVFAYRIINGSSAFAWIKLITFPVFIISVITGGLIVAKSTLKYKIIVIEGILLSLCGVTFYLTSDHLSMPATYGFVMLIVFAMGLQNTFGKLLAKETFGPTTVMTGNVTQASLDLLKLIKSDYKDKETYICFLKQLTILGGFTIGCILGALIGNLMGLSAILLPGMLMIAFYYSKGLYLLKA